MSQNFSVWGGKKAAWGSFIPAVANNLHMFSAHLHMCQMSNAGRLWKKISVPQHKQDETIIVLKHFFPSLQI